MNTTNSLKIFPDNPYDGQIILDNQNISWRWNGKGWIRQSGSCSTPQHDIPVHILHRVHSLPGMYALSPLRIGDRAFLVDPTDKTGNTGTIYTNISGVNHNATDWKITGPDTSKFGIYYNDPNPKVTDKPRFTQTIQAGTF